MSPASPGQAAAYELRKAGSGCTIKQDDSAARVHRDHCYALARPLGNDTAMQTKLSVVDNTGLTQGCSVGIGDGKVYYNNSEDTPYHPSWPRVCVAGNGGAFLGDGVCTPDVTFKPVSDEVEKNDCLWRRWQGCQPASHQIGPTLSWAAGVTCRRATTCIPG